MNKSRILLWPNNSTSSMAGVVYRAGGDNGEVTRVKDISALIDHKKVREWGRLPTIAVAESPKRSSAKTYGAYFKYERVAVYSRIGHGLAAGNGSLISSVF